MNRPLDLIGRRYGRWLVLSFAGWNQHNKLWLCLCNCGTQKTVRQPHLTGGHSLSCGCLKGESTRGVPNLRTRTHGMSDTPEYRAWSGMLTRCYNTKADSYPSYGGRGILVCDGWRHSFDAFITTLGTRPGPGYSLDRIDNDAVYSCGKCSECEELGRPLNCRWATPKQQTNNRRDRAQWKAIGAVGAPGEANANARFTEDDVREIRRRYAAGGISQHALGREYGVRQSVISAITTGRKWRHVS